MNRPLRKPRPAANDVYPKSSAHIITLMPRRATPDRMMLVAVTAAMIATGFMMGLALNNAPKGYPASGMNFAAPVSVAVQPTAPAPVIQSAPVVASAPALNEAPVPPAAMQAALPIAAAPVSAAPPAQPQTPALYDITLPEDSAAVPSVMIATSSPAETETVEHIIKRARASLDAKDFDDALALYGQVLGTDADNPAALAGEAYILQATGNDDQAADAFRRLLALDPSDVSARDGLAATLGHAQSPRALKELRKLEADAPASATVQAALAQFLSHHNDMKGAFDHLLRALELDPGNAAYRLDLAVFYDRAGNTNEALALYRQVLDDASIARDPNELGALARPALPLNAVRARAAYLAEMSGGFQ